MRLQSGRRCDVLNPVFEQRDHLFILLPSFLPFFPFLRHYGTRALKTSPGLGNSVSPTPSQVRTGCSVHDQLRGLKCCALEDADHLVSPILSVGTQQERNESVRSVAFHAVKHTRHGANLQPIGPGPPMNRFDYIGAMDRYPKEWVRVFISSRAGPVRVLERQNE